MLQKYLKIIYTITLYFFALIGLIFTLVFLGMQIGIFNVKGSIAERNAFFVDNQNDKKQNTASVVSSDKEAMCNNQSHICSWNDTREWLVVKNGLMKDAEIINQVSKETGISARLIAAVVIPEQLRFFTSEREVFKRYFEPLKILGSMSQFSLGVSGIKPETAIKIEEYANDKISHFYPGDIYSTLISYSDMNNIDEQRYERLTDAKNHYYSYLYTAIYLKEIQSQWKNAGFDISDNSEVQTTLFNLGFSKSKPHSSPKVGGTVIYLGGSEYLYGEIGSLFYNSNELLTEFPKE